MARFYKTASAAPMDYMYEMNIPLMQQAMQANEAGVNTQIQQADQLGDIASKFQYLQPDTEKAQQIAKGYSDQVDQLTKSIQNDPMNWRRKKETIKNLGKDLPNNYRTGEISKITYNYSKYKELDDYITKREEAGKVTPYEGAAFRAKALESIKDGTKYNPTTGTYNLVSAVKPMDTINIRERASKYVDGMKANGQLRWDTKTGQYLIKTTNGEEGITPEKIIQTAMQGIMGDTELMQYMKQRSDFGLMNGVFDKEGKFISPYNTVPIKMTTPESESITRYQEQIARTQKTDPALAEKMQQELDKQVNELSGRQTLQGNPSSTLYPIIQSLAGEYSFSKVTGGTDVKNNSLTNLMVNNAFQGQQKALDRAQSADQFQKNFDQRDTFHKDMMDLGKYKVDHAPVRGTMAERAAALKAAKAAGTVPANATSLSSAAPLKKDSAVVMSPAMPNTSGSQDANPFSHDEFYTNNGLSQAVVTNRKAVADNTKKVAEYQNAITNLMKGRDIDQLSQPERAKLDEYNISMKPYQDQLFQATETLGKAREWSNKALDFAVNSGAGGQGVSALNTYEKGIFKASQNPEYLASLKAQNTKLQSQVRDAAPGMAPDKGQIALKETIAHNEELLKDVDRVKSKVDKRIGFYLNEARSKSVVDRVPTIEFGSLDRDTINNMFVGKTHDLALFTKDGTPGDQIEVDSKGFSLNNSDNYKLSFADNNLPTYLENNGGKMEVIAVSPTMGLGRNSGATARVRFVSKDGSDKNVGDLSPDKDYYVTLPQDIQVKIGSRYANNSDPKIAAVGRQLLDFRDQAVRNQLIDVRNKVNPIIGNVELSKTVQFPISGGKTINVQVKSVYNGNDEYRYYATIRKNDGTVIPLPSTSSTTGAGWFEGEDHLINDFYKAFPQDK